MRALNVVAYAARVRLWERTRAAYATGMLAFLLIPVLAIAQSAKTDAQIVAEADAAFDQGMRAGTLLLQSRRQFALAADRYLDLHRRGVRSPALYLNLGNAATLADRMPEAIWACHMGLHLDPNSSEVRTHLMFLRGKVHYPPAGQGRLETDPWPPWLYRPTLYETVCISIISYIALCFAAMFAFIRRSPLWIALATAFLLSAGASAIGVWREASRVNADRAAPLVVVADNTPLYRGNAASYPTHPLLTLLYRGMEVRQIHRRGAWLQVRLTTGEIGWLPRSSALIVEP